MTLSQIIGVKGDECQCGRRATIRHCPSCGSTRTYARMNKLHKCLDGEFRHADTEYRCQSCGHLYIEEERQFCEAPPVGQKLASQRVKAIHEADKKGEHLRPTDKKIADAIRALTPELIGSYPDQYNDVELKNAWFGLRRVWIDLKIEKKGAVELPLLAFLSKHLSEAKMPQQYIDKILQWQRDETARLEPSNG